MSLNWFLNSLRGSFVHESVRQRLGTYLKFQGKRLTKDSCYSAVSEQFLRIPRNNLWLLFDRCVMHDVNE